MKRPTNKQLEEQLNSTNIEESFDCSDSIMDCIKSGRAHMRARWLVLTEEIGIKASWVIALLFAVAIINIDLFILSKAPHWEFMEFGTSGFEVFAKNFPYGWFAFALILLALAIYMMHNFTWSYAYPFKVFALLLVLSVVTFGGITFATGINDKIYMKLVEEPGAGDSFLAKMYCVLANREMESSHAVRGEIMYMDNSSIVIQTPSLEVVTVSLSEDTKIMDDEALKKYDYIKMVGEQGDGIFLASIIKKQDQSVGSMPINRDEQDCTDKKEWEHTQDVVEQRRRAVHEPLSPMQGTAELIQSIY